MQAARLAAHSRRSTTVGAAARCGRRSVDLPRTSDKSGSRGSASMDTSTGLTGLRSGARSVPAKRVLGTSYPRRAGTAPHPRPAQQAPYLVRMLVLCRPHLGSRCALASRETSSNRRIPLAQTCQDGRESPSLAARPNRHHPWSSRHKLSARRFRMPSRGTVLPRACHRRFRAAEISRRPQCLS